MQEHQEEGRKRGLRALLYELWESGEIKHRYFWVQRVCQETFEKCLP